MQHIVGEGILDYSRFPAEHFAELNRKLFAQLRLDLSVWLSIGTGGVYTHTARTRRALPTRILDV